MALHLPWCPIRVITTFDEFLREFGLPAWHIHVGGGVCDCEGFGVIWGVNEVDNDRRWGYEVLAGNGGRDIQMPPKRTSTFETPAITLDAIRQLIVDFTAALEAQTAAMANTDNPNRNT
ncbi:hypothetical protein Tco_1272186 [Tanacetum coccineum]